MKYKVEDLLKGGMGLLREEQIKLAEQEIRQWQKFLKDLKKENKKDLHIKH